MNAIRHPEPPIRTAPMALWRIAEAFLRILYMLFGAPEDVARQHTMTLKPYQLLASWLRVGEALMRRLLLIEAAAYPKPNTRPLLREPRRRVRKLMGFSPDDPDAWRVSFRCFSPSCFDTLSMTRWANGAHHKSVSLSMSKATRHKREHISCVTLRHAQRDRSFSSPACGGSVSARSAMTMGANGAHLKSVSLSVSKATRTLTPSGRFATTSPASGGGHRFRSAWPLAERYEALLRVFNNPAPYAKRLAAHLHAKPQRVAEVLHAPPEAEHRIDQYDALDAAARGAWPGAPPAPSNSS